MITGTALPLLLTYSCPPANIPITQSPILFSDVTQFLTTLDEKKLSKTDRKMRDDLVRRLRDVGHQIDVEGVEPEEDVEDGITLKYHDLPSKILPP